MLVADVNFEMFPKPGDPDDVTVPEPDDVWQAPSAPRYWLPEQAPKRFTISLAAAGAMLVDVVNFEIVPGAADPEEVTVPEPAAVWHPPSAPRY
jgi:hypothetical protein